MTYLVNDVFYTIQGEGYWTGRAAVFVRFARCNLWSGYETDRHSSVCRFCDTEFASYTEYTADELAAVVYARWPAGRGGQPMVVFTGGEPSLQLDEDLLDALDPDGRWYIAVETNGTRPLPVEVDWVCVSPKTPIVRVSSGDELKLVYPQGGRIQPEAYQDLDFNVFWLSPMDVRHLDIEEAELVTAENTAAAVEYVKAHPQWRLNIQTHKVIGVA